MQRARRLASIAAIATVGLLALAGCRSQPTVAAYVGDHRITEDQVTAITDEIRQKLPRDSQVQAPARIDVVRTLVLGDVCARLAADKGYQPRARISAEQLAQATGLPADSTFARQWAELETCRSGLPISAEATPTPEQFADVIARGRAAGVIPANVSDEQAEQQLDGEQLRSALGMSKALTDAVSGYDVTVNPRYRPLEYPLLSFQNNGAAVAVPLAEDDSPVVAPR